MYKEKMEIKCCFEMIKVELFIQDCSSSLEYLLFFKCWVLSNYNKCEVCTMCGMCYLLYKHAREKY